MAYSDKRLDFSIWNVIARLLEEFNHMMGEVNYGINYLITVYLLGQECYMTLRPLNYGLNTCQTSLLLQ